MNRRTKLLALTVLSVICLTFALVILCGCDDGNSYIFEGVEYLVDTENGTARVVRFYGSEDENGRLVCEIPAYVYYKGAEYPVVELRGRLYFMAESDPLAHGGKITHLIVPETVTSIDLNSFAVSSLNWLESIIVHPDNPAYKSIDGVLYSKDGKELIFMPNASNSTQS